MSKKKSPWEIDDEVVEHAKDDEKWFEPITVPPIKGRPKLSDAEVKARMEAHEKRKVGAIKIAEVDSDQKDHPPYPIMFGSDHVVFCSCPGWQYSPETPQNCKHLRKFIAAIGGHR
jgi:hypothetical protein